METSASVTISTEQKLKNLRVALLEVERYLRHEGRYVSANTADLARRSIEFSIMTYPRQELGHD